MRWFPLLVLLVTGSARAAGLLAPTDQTLPPLRVTDHLVDAQIHDQVAMTTITQPVSGMHGFRYPPRTHKAASQTYGTVRFSVALDTSAPLKNIWSPSHAIKIVR